MRVQCQEGGGEVDQNGGGVRILLIGSKQPSLKLDGVRRTEMHTDELSSTLRADELLLHRIRRRSIG